MRFTVALSTVTAVRLGNKANTLSDERMQSLAFASAWLDELADKDLTAGQLMTLCDKDGDAKLNQGEAINCVDTAFALLMKEQTKPIKDAIKQYWPYLAGQDGFVDAKELENFTKSMM